MKLSSGQIRILVSAAFYTLLLICYAVRPPEATGIFPAVILPAALQALISIKPRRRNSLSFALTLIPSAVMATSIATCSALLQLRTWLPGLVSAAITRLVNDLRRWPDSRPATLHWVGAAIGMMTFAATAAILLRA